MPFAVSAEAQKGGTAKSSLMDQIEEYQDVEHGEGTVQQKSLYAEARHMLAAAYLMFILPDMRALMRQGEQLQGDPEMLRRVLQCPCTALDVATIFNTNLARMQELVQDEERASMYNDSMDLNHPDLNEIQLLVMDDEKGDEECVYSLAVNHPKKMVSVLFRGSVTTKDFVQDAKALVATVDNPLKGDEAPKLLGLHLGFKEYLYEELPWHEMFIPNLVKEGLQQTAHVAMEGADVVGKGVVTAGKTVVSAGTAAGTAAVDVTKMGVQAVGTVAKTGVSAVGTVAKTGADAMGTVAKTGVGAITTVTDMVGVTHTNTSNNKTSSANDKETSSTAPPEQPQAPAGTAAQCNDMPDVTMKSIGAGTMPATDNGGNAIETKETIEVDIEGGVTPTNVNGDGQEQPMQEASQNDKPERGKKYEIIMDQVKQVFAEYPDYRLYIGGHSLGGALATIFAFECAAAESGITKPVTCITSGAPKVGNLHFLQAFESLEVKRHLRCIHVANYRDIVTQSPALPMCCCYGNHFRRAGFHLTLSPHGFILSYPPKLNIVVRFFLDILKWIKHIVMVLLFVPLLVICGCRTKKFLREEHTQLKYMNRFDNQKTNLHKMTLDELYEERYGGIKKKHLHVGLVKTSLESKEITAAMEIGNLTTTAK